MRTILPFVIVTLWLGFVTAIAGIDASWLCGISMLGVALTALWEAGRAPPTEGQGDKR